MAQLLGDRYALLRPLGAGAMGSVQVAQDTWQPGVQVAIKCAAAGDEAARAALEREFVTLRLLRHPGVIAAADFGVCARTRQPFFTMDIGGASDAGEFARGASIAEIATLALESSRILAFVHSRGIVHGDIKAENILVAREGSRLVPRFVDFGLARPVGQPGERAFSGSLTHAAPEMLAGAAADPRADLYSLGVTLFGLLAGRLPFDEADGLALAEAHRLREPPPIRSLRPDVPEPLASLVARLLAKDASRRPATAHAVAATLEGLVPDFPDESLESLQAWARAPRLIGRADAERAGVELLDRACDPSRPGPRSLGFEGAEGGGKTRLLDRLAELAQLRRVGVLRGEAGAEPWSLFVGLLRDAQRLAGPGASEVPAGLALLDPSLASADHPAPSGLSAEDARLLVGRAAWELLSAAAVTPMLLLFDSVERCDTESGWLLGFLLRQLELQEGRGRRLPLSIVVATRDLDGVSSIRLLPGHFPRQRLPALGEDLVGEIVASMFPGCLLGASLAQRLSQGVGGQARLIQNWCAELVAEGALQPGARGWEFDEAHPASQQPPRDLAAPLTRVLAALAPPDWAVVLDLALLPRPLQFASLAELEATDGAILATVVASLERRECVVVRVGADGRGVAIASDALRHAALAHAGEAASRARAAELLVAPALASVLVEADRARVAESAGQLELARELLLAELATASARHDHARAASHAARLADITTGAPRRAAWRHAATALIELERLDEAGRMAEHAAEALLDDERAEQAMLEGRLEQRLGRSARAFALFTQAIDHVSPDVPSAQIAEWRLARARAASAAGLPDAERLLDELDSSAGDDRNGLGILLARGAHQLRDQRTSEAVATLSRAAELARLLGARLEEASCENNLGVAALRVEDHDAALGHLNRSVELRLAEGARGAAAGTLANLSLLELERGNAPAAIKSARQGLAVHEDVGSLRGMLLARLNIAVAHGLREDWSACETELVRVAELEPHVGDPQSRGVRLLAEAELRRGLGQTEQAVALAQKVTEIEQSKRMRQSALVVAASCGDETALTSLAASLEEDTWQPEQALAAHCVLIDRALDAATWTSISLASAQPQLPDSDRERARRWAEAAFALARSRRSRESLTARLALALAEARDGEDARVAALLAGASTSEERLARPSTRAILAAARGWLAARAGDLAAAERSFARGIDIARRQLRRVPRGCRAGFLAAPPWRGLREALVAVQQRRLDEARVGSFFAVLATCQGSDASSAVDESIQDLRHAARDAERRAERLTEILEISRGISALRPVGELLLSMLGSAMGFMDADRGFIVLCSDEGLDFAVARDRDGREMSRAEFAISRSVLDEVIRTRQAVLSADARSDERFVGGASVLALDLRSVLVAPLIAREAVIGAIYLDNHHASGVFNEGDRDLLARLATQAAVAVENARLHEASVEKERMESELGIAREIQQRLLPKNLPGTAAFRVAAAMEPAREIGGDYYDFIDAGDGRLRVAIGDVSGKGVPAGLFMIMARTILRSLAVGEAPLDRVLADANDVLESQVDDDKFMTMLLLEPSRDGRSVRVCLAGHEPPLMWRRAHGGVEALAEGGIALGMLRGIGARLEERLIPMESGDVLACYTDGVTECRSASGEMFGRARLEEALAAAARGGAQSVLDSVLSAIARFRGDAERHDDMTLVVLEARP